MKTLCSVIVKILSFVLLAVCACRMIYDSTHLFLTIFGGVIMLISCPLCTVLHEAGHTLFGLTVKIKAVPEEKYGTFLKRTFIDWWQPSSCKIIPKTDVGLRRRLLFTAMGGLAVNAIFIILGIIAMCVPAVPTELCALMPASFHLFALNALPFGFDCGKSDGKIIYELIKNTDEAKVTVAVLTVQARVLSGHGIETVDKSLLFDVPQICEDDLAFISLCELRYEYFSAIGDEENAEKWRVRFETLRGQYLKGE